MHCKITRNSTRKKASAYLVEERVDPFREGLLLDVLPLFFEHIDAVALKAHVLADAVAHRGVAAVAVGVGRHDGQRNCS